jgi:hypothetical protein
MPAQNAQKPLGAMSTDAAGLCSSFIIYERDIYNCIYFKEYFKVIMHRELGERVCLGIRPKMNLICFIKVNNI